MEGPSVGPLGEGWYLVSDGSHRWHVAVASDDASHWVFVDGLVAQVSLAERAQTRSRSKTSESGVMAPMPATVVAIHVASGQTVQQGDTLIVLEAMKMELPIRSPRNGVIKSIRCAKGELVQPGINLMELE